MHYGIASKICTNQDDDAVEKYHKAKGWSKLWRGLKNKIKCVCVGKLTIIMKLLTLNLKILAILLVLIIALLILRAFSSLTFFPKKDL